MPEGVTDDGVGGGADEAAAAAAVAAAAGGGAEDTPFYSGFSDTGLKTWAEGKGWQTAEAAVKSAFHLEKMVGAPADQVLRVPQPGDTEGMARVYDRLGRPDDPAKYDLPDPGEDPAMKGYLDHMRTAFHAAGLSAEQAKAVMGAGTAYVSQAETAAAEDYNLAAAEQQQTLQREWGNGYERQLRVAQQATEALGFTGEMINGIESVVGYAETMKFMAKLGAKMGEDKFVSGDGAGAGPGGIDAHMTPEQAKVQWEAFRADAGNVAALTDKKNPGHALAMQKKTALFGLMYPGEG